MADQELSNQTDGELLAIICSSESDTAKARASETFRRRHQRMVFQVCFHNLRHQEDAIEMMILIFEYFEVMAAKYRDSRSLRGLLKKAAHDRSANVVKRRARYFAALNDLVLEKTYQYSHYASEAFDAGRHALVSNDELREAISRLPQRQAQVLQKMFFEGKAGSDIAEDMGLKPARVSQIKSEAIERLKEKFRDRTSALVCFLRNRRLPGLAKSRLATTFVGMAIAVVCATNCYQPAVRMIDTAKARTAQIDIVNLLLDSEYIFVYISNSGRHQAGIPVVQLRRPNGQGLTPPGILVARNSKGTLGTAVQIGDNLQIHVIRFGHGFRPVLENPGHASPIFTCDTDRVAHSSDSFSSVPALWNNGKLTFTVNDGAGAIRVERP